MYQAYAIRPVGETVLFNDGGLFDRVFSHTNHAVRQFATDFYTIAGRFRANLFETDLRQRGLFDCDYGPELPHVPFYEDGKPIIEAIKRFIESYVHAYYDSDAFLALDWEAQAWIAEANDAAGVLDFYKGPLETLEVLIEIITHVAWLCGVSHHVLNAGEPFATSGTLPLHPAALYMSPPTKKGVKDLIPFLPNTQQAAEQIALLARFNRPQLESKMQTLLHMFNHDSLHERAQFANERFMMDMRLISEDIEGKQFDADGLCQGMPFVWRGMDPSKIPFFLSV